MILHTDSTDNSKDPSAPDMDENGDLTEAADRTLGSPAVRKQMAADHNEQKTAENAERRTVCEEE